MQNLAVTIHGAHDVRVEERTIPIPGAGQVQVAVAKGGICGSDLSYYSKGAVGHFRVKHPMVLGHEVVGRVSDAGPGVAIGDGLAVVVDPSSPCQTCDRCLEGRSNACERPTFLGSASTDPHVDGGFSSLLVVGEHNLVPVPSGLTDDLVVFAEPLAVTVHALRRAGGVRDKRVLVVGAGPIGSILVGAALHRGAAEVVVTDLATDRLALADGLGAHRTFVAGQEEPGDDFDVVFECSGSAPGIATAVASVRRAGVAVLVGLPHGGPVELPIGLAVSREIDVLGSFRFNHDEFVDAVEMLGSGLDLSTLVSASYSCADASAAFEGAVLASNMKVQLDFT